ncbi:MULTISPECIES: cupin domain-containing protein [Aphanothece]|uniref:cupin domain-containing protein n=1 Tax=Aphanothece TaxID=1121 RepID=UPI0039852F7C
MTRGWIRAALVCLAAGIGAGPVLPARADSKAVVPERERQGLEHLLPGAPKETRGVLSVRLLGSTDLEQDFPSMQGYVLRAREITVAPGGQIGVHRHERRPGVAVMLEGEMTERRAPGARPKPLAPGEVAFEAAGVVHWWRNETDAPAKAIVIDIVPKDLP